MIMDTYLAMYSGELEDLLNQGAALETPREAFYAGEQNMLPMHTTEPRKMHEDDWEDLLNQGASLELPTPPEYSLATELSFNLSSLDGDNNGDMNGNGSEALGRCSSAELLAFLPSLSAFLPSFSARELAEPGPWPELPRSLAAKDIDHDDPAAQRGLKTPSIEIALQRSSGPPTYARGLLLSDPFPMELGPPMLVHQYPVQSEPIGHGRTITTEVGARSAEPVLLIHQEERPPLLPFSFYNFDFGFVADESGPWIDADQHCTASDNQNLGGPVGFRLPSMPSMPLIPSGSEFDLSSGHSQDTAEQEARLAPSFDVPEPPRSKRLINKRSRATEIDPNTKDPEQRRKLKNRRTAAASRDRKSRQMVHMDQAIQDISRDNSLLRNTLEELRQANAAMKAQLASANSGGVHIVPSQGGETPNTYPAEVVLAIATLLLLVSTLLVDGAGRLLKFGSQINMMATLLLPMRHNRLLMQVPCCKLLSPGRSPRLLDLAAPPSMPSSNNGGLEDGHSEWSRELISISTKTERKAPPFPKKSNVSPCPHDSRTPAVLAFSKSLGSMLGSERKAPPSPQKSNVSHSPHDGRTPAALAFSKSLGSMLGSEKKAPPSPQKSNVPHCPHDSRTPAALAFSKSLGSMLGSEKKALRPPPKSNVSPCPRLSLYPVALASSKCHGLGSMLGSEREAPPSPNKSNVSHCPRVSHTHAALAFCKVPWSWQHAWTWFEL